MTGEQLGFGTSLNVLGTPEEQLMQLNAVYDDWIKTQANALVPSSEMDEDVEVHVDETTLRKCGFRRRLTCLC